MSRERIGPSCCLRPGTGRRTPHRRGLPFQASSRSKVRVARGQRVTYPVPDRFADAVAATGATPLLIRSDLPDPAKGEQWPEGGVEAMRLFFDEARSAYAQISAVLAGDLIAACTGRRLP